MNERAGELAAAAAALVAGPRREDHGDAAESFQRVANLWNTWLAVRPDPSGPIRPSDVCQMMALLKMVRGECGAPKPDHAIDQCGYAALAGALREQEFDR